MEEFNLEEIKGKALEQIRTGQPLLGKDDAANRIIGLYAMGNSTRQISDWMYEHLGYHVSEETVSAITDRILPELKAWKTRTLDAVYPIVWLDALHYKVKDEQGRVVSRAIYNVLAVNGEGKKELLGMYISHYEGANFWLSVLTDLQNRGVEGIMIVCVGGLRGFSDAIQSVYPKAIVQLCIIHQMRNTMKYVSYKNQKEITHDLKLVYGAVNKNSAELELDNFENKWGEQYPIVIRLWRENWAQLSNFLQFTPRIRTLIFTTDAVEGYNRQIHKVTKNKGVFSSDTALEKLVYLAYRKIAKEWEVMPIRGWHLRAQQLAIVFADRLNIL